MTNNLKQDYQNIIDKLYDRAKATRWGCNMPEQSLELTNFSKEGSADMAALTLVSAFHSKYDLVALMQAAIEAITEINDTFPKLLRAAEAVVDDTTIDHGGSYNEESGEYELSNKNTINCLGEVVDEANKRRKVMFLHELGDRKLNETRDASRKANDPVFKKKGKWYFWDEIWIGTHGPFNSEQEARAELDKYVEYLNKER